MMQAPLSGPAAVAVGLAALGVVVMDVGWEVVRHGTVMAHEGAHAVADSLLGRQVDYINLNFDAEKSGETYPKNEGGCLARVVVAFVGYIGPSSFGLGAAKLIQHGDIVAVLWLTLFLLGILLLLLRWSFGLLSVPLAGGLVYIIGRYTPVPAQIVAAYAIAWLLLLSGVRGILVRGTKSGDGEKLSQLTLIPRVIWFLLWLAATLLAVAIGGSWLVMRT
jgi:Peptidase M50B-like